MTKIKRCLNKIIEILTAGLFSWIVGLLAIAYYVNFSCKKVFLMDNIRLCLVGIILLSIIILVGTKTIIGSIFTTKVEKILPVVAVLFLIVQIWICYNIFFETGWDSGGVIIPTVRALLNGESVQHFNDSYFVIYPNNVFLVNIYWLILKINDILGLFKGEYQLMAIVVVNCILSSLSCWLVYLIAKKELSQKIAISIYFISLVLIGVSPWMVICYSDSLAIFMPILIVYLYLKENLGVLLKSILILVIGYLGYCIKPQVLIIIVAIFIIEFVKNLDSINKKLITKLCASLIISLVVVTMISTGMNKIYSVEGLDVKSEQSVGPTHYFMMGLNKKMNGVYLRDDVVLSISCKTKKERTKVNMEVALDRIKKMGPKGYFKFLSKKMLTNYDDGTFAWGIEGGFYSKVSELPNKSVAPALRSFYYNDGKYHIIYSTIVQGIWILIVVGCCIQMVIALFKKNSENKVYRVMSLALVGITIFELLFEARARYLYIYVPIYILVFGYFLQSAKNILKKRHM